MKKFRKYSDKYSFRERSENAESIVPLSLLPWEEFGVDGVILFSDILTPLPALGIDFEIEPGVGPKIVNPISTAADVDRVGVFSDIEAQVPFLRKSIEVSSLFPLL